MMARFTTLSQAPTPPLFERPLSLMPSQEIAIGIHCDGKYAAKPVTSKIQPFEIMNLLQ